MTEKVMMIGLDGATWSLLEPWISDSKLPTFKKLINSGSRAVLKSTVPCVTCPALPSMYTGVNPGSFGIFFYLKRDGSPVTPRDIGYPTIWNVLDRYNYSSCIVNLRVTYPPEKLNGVMICGNPVPSDKSNYTYPEDLKERIVGFRDDRIRKKINKIKNDKKHRKDLLELIMKQTERRYGIFKKLNEERDYDFSFFWIDETDQIQHICWEDKEILLQFFHKLDDILNDLLLSFPNRNFLIVSDHGFESSPEKLFYVNTWLFKEGYLSRVGGPFLQRIINFAQFFASRCLNLQRLERLFLQYKKLNLSMHKRASDQLMVIKKLDSFPGISKENSVAYLATTFGIDVVHSDNYETIREEIIEKLKKIEDANGERVMKDVWKKEDIYTGKYLWEIPDIIFLTSEKYVPSPVLTKNLFGEIKKRAIPWGSGDHTKARDGILIAYGPIFKERTDLGDVSIEDITPTILHSMGCKIPEHVDGKVLVNIFKKNSDPAKRKPSLRKFIYIKEVHRLEKGEEEQIKDRLRELGYL